MYIENLFRINEEYDEIKICRVCILYVYRMYGYFLIFLFWLVIFVIEVVDFGVCFDEVVCCFVRFLIDFWFIVWVVDSNLMFYFYNIINVIYFNLIFF